MAFPGWLVGGRLLIVGLLAQSPSAPPTPPPAPPPSSSAVSPAHTPAGSGARLLGTPGIRTRYADPAAPAPTPAAQRLPSAGLPAAPLSVPLNRSLEFTPTMEEGPFQRPTIRGLLRWDLQPTPSR